MSSEAVVNEKLVICI